MSPLPMTGDVQARIGLDACNHFPIGRAGVHLRTCASVHGDGGYAAILQGLGQVYNDAVVVIPSGAGFYGHRQVYCVHYCTGDFNHF